MLPEIDGPEIAVLPEISGPELVATLQHIQNAERAIADPETFAMQIAQACGADMSMLVRAQDFDHETIQKAFTEAGVSFVGGDSDEESIRDQESGPAKFRWHRREAYFYRREPNLK